jgi:L-fucose isomerase-like protein
MKDNDDLAQAKLAAIQKYVDSSSVPQAALLKMAKLGAVVDQWMAATEVSISAVQCWTSIEENLGVVPCTAMSMMSDSLLSSACEVDICGVLGMHALRLASQSPSALEHHVAANLSTVASAVHEATTRYLGWNMYWHGRNMGAC